MLSPYIHPFLRLLSVLFITFGTVRSLNNQLTTQEPFRVTSMPIAVSESKWKVILDKHWDILGPFPIHAREQYFLSPAFPLNLNLSVENEQDKNLTWPSSLADGGNVTWTKADSNQDAYLQVSFPDIRWSSLRSTEGWSSLQHHNVLRTSMTVHPPPFADENVLMPHLLVYLSQASFFSLRPREIMKGKDESLVPKWHIANIYELEKSPPNSVEFPVAPSLTKPTTYDLLVSGDYEIRLFGDPQASGRESPVLSVKLSVDIETSEFQIIRDPSQDIVCDFLNGAAFGNSLGFGLRSINGFWTVKRIYQQRLPNGVELILLDEIRIAPSQTRVVPIKIVQTRHYDHDLLSFSVELSGRNAGSSDTIIIMPVEINIRQLSAWNPHDYTAIKATYLYASLQPTAFLAIPPKFKNDGPAKFPILALHGAGVNILSSSFWSDSIPRQNQSWIVLPTGRTAWGLDWHGPSAVDAWNSVEALSAILEINQDWRDWGYTNQTKVIVIGHSNGGQGAWYLASRYPDRIAGVAAAAAYVKSQQYVALTQSRAAHYMDPALRAVLEFSLTPDDNDLFMSNLAHKPVLAIHGGDDDNVPVWHSREYVSVLRSWGSINVTLIEDAGELHWYPTVFKSGAFQAFVDSVLDTNPQVSPPDKFTLTVVQPVESGSMYGWKIEGLATPGRLSRLHVSTRDNFVAVQTMNVRTFSVAPGVLTDVTRITINDNELEMNGIELRKKLSFHLSYDVQWNVQSETSSETSINVSTRGRLINLLSSPGLISIVIPSETEYPDIFSIALRIAHNLNVYHKLDTSIVTDEEAISMFQKGILSTGNIVTIGNVQENTFSRMCLGLFESEFKVQNDIIVLRDRPIKSEGTGILFTHPHPSHPSSLMLFMIGTDLDGLERAFRLFPLRTGVPVPDWIVIGKHADQIGAAGVIAAGVWNENWQWNEAMSWFS